MAMVRIAVLLGIFAVLLSGVLWGLPRVVPDDWTQFSGTAWRTPSPEPPSSDNATEAARDLLPYRDRIIAAYVIAERPENQKTGGWPQENSAEAIASGIASAKLQTIASAEPIYRLPTAGATSESLWDAVVPSGAYLVTVTRPKAANEMFTLRRDQKGGWWWLDGGPVPVDSHREDELAQIRRLSGGRQFATRYVWRSQELSWWLVRFDDGTVKAWPSDHGHWPIELEVGGQPVDLDRLYPASAILDEVVSRDRSSLLPLLPSR